MRPARIVWSAPLSDHPWRQLAAWLDDADREGAIYHWIVDPDEGVCWQVVELADGTTITGTHARTLEDLRTPRWCYGNTCEVIGSIAPLLEREMLLS